VARRSPKLWATERGLFGILAAGFFTSMSQDISPILSRWQYEEGGGLQVRRIEAADGRPLIQMRMDLGLLQIEETGRPDGDRPYGCSTLLDYYRQRAEEHRREFGWYEGFELDSEVCTSLRREAMQFYHRRIARMALQDFQEAAGDADHNLEILDLLKAFAASREDWLVSEQFRAYIISQRVQCLTLKHLSESNVRAALLELEEGIKTLRRVFIEQDRLEDFEDSSELAVLLDLRRKLDGRHQISHRHRLQLLLDEALRREDPDEAAALRSQLRQLDADD
jgi:hypothetical protein